MNVPNRFDIANLLKRWKVSEGPREEVPPATAEGPSLNSNGALPTGVEGKRGRTWKGSNGIAMADLAEGGVAELYAPAAQVDQDLELAKGSMTGEVEVIRRELTYWR